MLSVSFLGLLPWPLPCLLTLPMVISLGIAPGQTDLTVDSSRCLDVSLLKQIVGGWLCTVDSGFEHPPSWRQSESHWRRRPQGLALWPCACVYSSSCSLCNTPYPNFLQIKYILGRLVSSCFLLHSFVRSLALENPDCKDFGSLENPDFSRQGWVRPHLSCSFLFWADVLLWAVALVEVVV